MRITGLCFLLAVLVVFAFTFGGGGGDGTIRYDEKIAVPIRATHRKMKENDFHGHGHRGYRGDKISLEDYSPVDPSPSSKAVRPGPIQHATPLIPYIPKPSPPDHPNFKDYQAAGQPAP